MESNARKSDSGRLRPSSVSCSEEKKQVRKIHARKVPYRVGYSWNKGGRLKELRIRHLARKFLKIWIENTFGQILPHEARSHYNSVLLRKAFEGWRDEWWTSRREWSLTMRAECHYRYYLYNLAFKSWRAFIPLQKEKKSRVQNTQSLGMSVERILVLTILCHFHLYRFSWRLWQTRLQQHKVLYSLEEQVLKQRALTIQRRTWLQWKETYIAACCQKEREYKASLHFNHRLKRKTIHCWKRYVDLIQTKRKSQGHISYVIHAITLVHIQMLTYIFKLQFIFLVLALVRRVCHSQLVRSFWTKWSSALYHKRREEERLQTAGYYAGQSPEHRAQQHWKACILNTKHTLFCFLYQLQHQK
uniref:SFI1 centrin binding protein n=1 Tax=Mola mola TaxID=94237 RepID=A0A3Q3XHZ9_MOLML